MKNVSKLLLKLIEDTLDNNGFDFENEINNMGHMVNIELRNRGKKFSFNEHLEGLIFSLLSNQRPWEPIRKNKEKIKEIFYNFNKEKILNTDKEVFVEKLKEIKCGNRAIKKQMESLNYNIGVLNRIEKDFDSLDKFVTNLSPHNIAKELASGDKYKLKQIGYALAFEYLRNVGIDAVKPDTHIIRILSNKRLGYSSSTPTPEEAVEILEYISRETGFSLSYIDALLWNFCASGYGDICTKEPKCKICKLDSYCEF
ncbi:MAG: hypothetical protein FH751_07350 [Firmicutes bacterium]|nr:hypothetical protein [Bacillota bacterium]